MILYHGIYIDKFNISLEQALSTIYSSRIYDLLLDSTIDLVADSPSYIYELLKDETKVSA